LKLLILEIGEELWTGCIRLRIGTSDSKVLN
jgi:hypothetical protein